eukprot:1152375-Pelagomonas_calceolata.AAC.2
MSENSACNKSIRAGQNMNVENHGHKKKQMHLKCQLSTTCAKTLKVCGLPRSLSCHFMLYISTTSECLVFSDSGSDGSERGSDSDGASDWYLIQRLGCLNQRI